MRNKNSPLRARKRASFARPDIYSKAKPYTVSDSYSTKIFLADKKFFGKVEDDTLHKTIHGDIHILQKPLAIAFDKSALELARQLGARKVEVFDTVSGILYKTTFSTIDAKGFDLPDRGYGEQRALLLQYWQKDDEPFVEQLELWK